MIRAFGRGQLICRQAKAARLRPFLQYGLRIARRRLHRADQRPPEALDKAESRSKTTVEIDRGDQRLAGIGEDRRLVGRAGSSFGGRKMQIAIKANRGRDLRERVAPHKLCEAAGQRPFRLGGVLPPEEIGDDNAEDTVAKEFEPLVVAWLAGMPRALGARAAALGLRQGARMRQRLAKQLGISEGMADPTLEIRRRPFRGGRSRRWFRAQLTPRNSRL